MFGYGSLIWNPGFSYVEKYPATLLGYRRRLWQGSVDHRGSIDFPGRVVTLDKAEDQVDGLAYRVADEDKEAVLCYLDCRESGGYERAVVEVKLSGSRVSALTYIAYPHNPHYLGPAPLDEIIARIYKAVGPSGRNLDYVLDLASRIHSEGWVDRHIESVSAGLRLYGMG